MALGIKDLMERAEAQVTNWAPEAAQPKLADENTVFVDIRDVRELERDGMVPGAKHAPRGMLEFWIDPASPYHKPYFAEDKTFVFYCASGWRSLLATKVAQEMGLKAVNLTGGFGAWKAAGLDIAERKPK
ncbi:rhodanese-like domain-containing protein [Pseudooceanicola sp.]|uniref:rhodanese-like domain-containing protein n=1 Tax=Pseudooceanicola sp. TaxID=1914328 RepID=UPI00260572F9|nr:rhodanese-like domain-containing protein [Pseudooceanicola sp.]MDF1855648.1 rhodanese-like domain-containing protein [Pseudooceanicola sp.]